MKRALLFLSVLVLLSQTSLKAQQQLTTVSRAVKNIDSTRRAILRYYRLGVQYKDGRGVPMDYAKACSYFEKAAELGDAQSIYAVAYMHYKGLGCTQDYPLAARLFAKGAYENRDNSMYFYGLCWRNGYGLEQREDSAQYWLKKAAALGYKQAIQELKMKAPENSSDSARTLMQNIHNAAIPQQEAINQFIAVKAELPDSSVIAGDYSGYLIQYDWSGQHIVSSRKLQLKLASSEDGKITGQWAEDSSTSVALNARLQQGTLLFDSSRYARKDHYSPQRPVQYDFEKASLNLVRRDDTVFLAGNIMMFSPERGEPSKPMFVALVRMDNLLADGGNKNPGLKGKEGDSTAGNSQNSLPAAQLLKVYPNPFHSYVNVDFKVNRTGKVAVELYTAGGKPVYRKEPELLTPGKYSIRVEPQTSVMAQAYVLRLVYDGGVAGVKVIRE